MFSPRQLMLYLCCGVMLLQLPQKLLASALPENEMWQPNGEVHAIEMVAGQDAAYIGGDFTYIGADTGSSTLVDLENKVPAAASWPKFNGVVHAAVPDGSDGWYLGGSFTLADGTTRNGLAHVDSGGALSGWNPNVTGGAIRSMVLNGATLYVGGDFSTVDAVTRSGLAAIDTTATVSGSYLLTWNPGISGGGVRSMVLNGVTLYVGGDFSTVDAVTRNGLAAIDTTATVSGSYLLTWNPDISGGGVRSMVLNGTTLYVGGDFTTIDVMANAVTRNSLAAIDTTASASGDYALAWNPDPDNIVRTMSLSGNSLYVGGDFTNIDINIAKFNVTDPSSISSMPWNFSTPGLASTYVSSIDASGTDVYVAWNGEVAGVGPPSLGRVMAYDQSSIATTQGQFDTGSAAVGGPVEVVINGPQFFVGGGFDSASGRIRNNIAQINLVKTNPDDSPNLLYGSATEWAPEVDGVAIKTILESGDGETVYIGGNFSNVNGDSRNNIAALETDSSAATTPWDPSIEGGGDEVKAMVLSPDENTLYVGGDFDSVAGETRNKIASLSTDATLSGTALVTEWGTIENNNGNPIPLDVDGVVNDLVISSDGNIIYAGGDFTIIGGELLDRVAALRASNGRVTQVWTGADANAVVRSLSLSSDDNILYFGGDFTNVNSTLMDRVAAVDASTGSLQFNDPDIDGPVSAVTLSSNDQMIWIGGHFANVAGSGRIDIARYNNKEIATNPITAWSPNTTNSSTIVADAAVVNTIERNADDSLILFGGDFSHVGGVERSNLAVFNTTPPTIGISPAGGVYSSDQDITFSCVDNAEAGGGCSIFYEQGTIVPASSAADDPTQASDEIVYVPPPPPTAPQLTITSNADLKFFARDSDGNVSETITVFYRFDSTAPNTVAQPQTELFDNFPSPTDGYPEISGNDGAVALICNDVDSNCEITYYTKDGTEPNDGDGPGDSEAVKTYLDPLTPQQLLPLDSTTLQDVRNQDGDDIFYDLTMRDIIVTEADAAIRIRLDELTLEDIPFSAINFESIDVESVRDDVDFTQIQLADINATVLDNVVAPGDIPVGAVTLQDVEDSGAVMDLTQISLAEISRSSFSLSDITLAEAPPPSKILANQVPLIQVNFLDGTENRVVLDAVNLHLITLEMIPSQFVPRNFLAGEVTLKFFSIDEAGNSETAPPPTGTGVKSVTYFVDIGAPETSATPNTGDNVFTSTVNVTLTCDDFAGSGCDATYYTLDGSTPNPDQTGAGERTRIYSGPIPISSAKTLRYMSIDKLGNAEEAKFDVYAFTFSSVGQAGVGSGGVIFWLITLSGLLLRQYTVRRRSLASHGI